MIAKFAIWIVKRYTNEFWNAYNEGFLDGKYQMLMDFEEEWDGEE
jgi:hypothetical protein